MLKKGYSKRYGRLVNGFSGLLFANEGDTHILATHLLVIVRRRVLGVDEQYVLRLQIGVRQTVLVQKLDRVAHLVGHVSHVVQRVRFVIVFALQTKIFH